MEPTKHLPGPALKDDVLGIDIVRAALHRGGSVREFPFVVTALRDRLVLWWWDDAAQDAAWQRLEIAHAPLDAPRPPQPGVQAQLNWSRRVGLLACPPRNRRLPQWAGRVVVVFKRGLPGHPPALYQLELALESAADDAPIRPVPGSGAPALLADDAGFDLWAGLSTATPAQLLVLTQQGQQGPADAARIVLLSADPDADLADSANWAAREIGSGHDFDALIEDGVLTLVYRPQAHAIEIALSPAVLAGNATADLEAPLTGRPADGPPLMLLRHDVASGEPLGLSALPGGEHPQLHRLPPLLGGELLVTVDRTLALARCRPASLVGSLFGPPAGLGCEVFWENDGIRKVVLRPGEQGPVEHVLYEIRGRMLPRSLAWLAPWHDQTQRSAAGFVHATLMACHPVHVARAAPDGQGEHLVLDLLRHDPDVGGLVVSRHALPLDHKPGPGRTIGFTPIDLNHGQITSRDESGVRIPDDDAENHQFEPPFTAIDPHFDLLQSPIFQVLPRRWLTDNTIGGALATDRGTPPLACHAYVDLGDGGARVAFGDGDPPGPPTVVPGTKSIGPDALPRAGVGEAWVDLFRSDDWVESGLPIYSNAADGNVALGTRLNAMLDKLRDDAAIFLPEGRMDGGGLLSLQDRACVFCGPFRQGQALPPAPAPHVSWRVKPFSAEIDATEPFRRIPAELELQLLADIEQAGEVASSASAEAAGSPFALAFTIEPALSATQSPTPLLRFDAFAGTRNTVTLTARASARQGDWGPWRTLATGSNASLALRQRPAVAAAASPVSFEARIQGFPVLADRLAWEFPDGTRAEGASATHTFATAGAAQVGLSLHVAPPSVPPGLPPNFPGWSFQLMFDVAVGAALPGFAPPEWQWSIVNLDDPGTPAWQFTDGVTTPTEAVRRGEFTQAGRFRITLDGALPGGGGAHRVSQDVVVAPPGWTWSIAAQDAAAAADGATFRFAQGQSAAMASPIGHFTSEARYHLRLDATLPDGSTRSATADQDVDPSLVTSLWAVHRTVNAHASSTDTLGQIEDAALQFKIGILEVRFSKYVMRYLPDSGGDRMRDTVTIDLRQDPATHDTQMRFLGNGLRQGRIDYRMRLRFHSDDVELSGTLSEWVKVESVDAELFYSRDFTPGLLTSDRRHRDPVTGDVLAADVELALPQRDATTQGAVLAAKPISGTRLEAGDVQVRAVLTPKARTAAIVAIVLLAIGAVALAATVALVLAPVVIVAATATGGLAAGFGVASVGAIAGVAGLAAGAVALAVGAWAASRVFDDWVPRALSDFASNQVRQQLATDAVRRALDGAGFLTDAGEGLAEALAIRALVAARDDGGLTDVAPPTADGLNRQRDPLWKMIHVFAGGCRMLLRR